MFFSVAVCALILLLFNESQGYVVDLNMKFVTATRAATRCDIPQHESVVSPVRSDPFLGKSAQFCR